LGLIQYDEFVSMHLQIEFRLLQLREVAWAFKVKIDASGKGPLL